MKSAKAGICVIALLVMGATWAAPERPPAEDRRPEATGPDELKALKTMRAGAAAEGKEGTVRTQALHDEGYSQGLQTGLVWRYGQIEALLRKDNVGGYLDVVFNFERLVIDNQMLPPVFSISNGAARLFDPTTARESRISYRMEDDARLITTPPSWEAFLVKNYQLPEKPSPVILPRNAEEEVIWHAALDEGWADGVKRANLVFEGSVARLTRTYQGMLNYRMLVAEGIVSKPIMAKTDLGVTSDGRELHVGDTISRITRPSEFKPETQWVPRPRDDTPVSLPR